MPHLLFPPRNGRSPACILPARLPQAALGNPCPAQRGLLPLSPVACSCQPSDKPRVRPITTFCLPGCRNPPLSTPAGTPPSFGEPQGTPAAGTLPQLPRRGPPSTKRGTQRGFGGMNDAITPSPAHAPSTTIRPGLGDLSHPAPLRADHRRALPATSWRRRGGGPAVWTLGGGRGLSGSATPAAWLAPAPAPSARPSIFGGLEVCVSGGGVGHGVGGCGRGSGRGAGEGSRGKRGFEEGLLGGGGGGVGHGGPCGPVLLGHPGGGGGAPVQVHLNLQLVDRICTRHTEATRF